MHSWLIGAEKLKRDVVLVWIIEVVEITDGSRKVLAFAHVRAAAAMHSHRTLKPDLRVVWCQGQVFRGATTTNNLPPQDKPTTSSARDLSYRHI